MLNSSKKSIVINLKDQAGIAVFLDLVEQSDVLIENFALGKMDSLGLGYERLGTLNPRLVYGSGKGYGLTGPNADLPAMDLNIQAMSGVIAGTGFQDGPPVKAGPAFMDFLGGVHLFGGIVTALLHRERTGRGQLVEVSMNDAVYPTLASALGGLYNEVGYAVPERTGNRHSGMGVAPYNVYPTLDGYVSILCVTNRHWQALLEEMDRVDLAEDDRFTSTHERAKNMAYIDEIVGDWCSQHNKWPITRQLQARGIAAAPVQSIVEVANDPHLWERGMIREVIHPRIGSVAVPGPPIRLVDSPVEEVSAAPDLGGHTDEVLTGLLGYSAERIRVLRSEGVVH